MIKIPSKNTLLLSTAIALAATVGTAPVQAGAIAATDSGNNAAIYLRDAVDGAEGYWSAATDGVRSWVSGFSTGSLLKRQLEGSEEKSDTDFKQMMGAAGYAVKSINMGVGLVPKFSLYFGQKRELSDADRVYLQRLLRKHERTRSGPVAAAQRLIIDTIVQLQEFPDYDLTKVAVTMLPLPYVEFVAEPKDTTLDPDMSYIAQRIKDLNLKLEMLSN